MLSQRLKLVGAGLLCISIYACRGGRSDSIPWDKQTAAPVETQNNPLDAVVPVIVTTAEPEAEDAAEAEELAPTALAAFPKLLFEAKNVPVLSSDAMRVEMTIAADAAISHYSYKISSEKNCDKADGYIVSETRMPLNFDQEPLPIGPVFVCMIAYHFPSKRWQPLTEAVVYTWNKVALKRAINSTFDVLVEANCASPTRVRYRSVVDFQGDKGTYRYSAQVPGGCNLSSGAFSGPLTEIKVVGNLMTGKFADGSGFKGWFRFQFTNPERTAFVGSWGADAAQVEPLGIWNSNP